jgi:hypothetical protein
MKSISQSAIWRIKPETSRIQFNLTRQKIEGSSDMLAASEIAVAADCFQSFAGDQEVESVRKIKSGPECCQWLQTKLRNTVLVQQHERERE